MTKTKSKKLDTDDLYLLITQLGIGIFGLFVGVGGLFGVIVSISYYYHIKYAPYYVIILLISCMLIGVGFIQIRDAWLRKTPDNPRGIRRR